MRKVSTRQLQLVVELLSKARPIRTTIKPKEERLIKEKTEIRPHTMNYPMGMK